MEINVLLVTFGITVIYDACLEMNTHQDFKCILSERHDTSPELCVCDFNTLYKNMYEFSCGNEFKSKTKGKALFSELKNNFDLQNIRIKVNVSLIERI